MSTILQGVDISSAFFKLITDTRGEDTGYASIRWQGPNLPYYEIEIETDELTQLQNMDLAYEIEKSQAEGTDLLLQNPLPQIGMGGRSQTLQFKVSPAKGATSVALKGFLPNEVNAVVKGEFIRPHGFPKAYRLGATLNADANGEVNNVPLAQGLYVEHAINTSVDYGQNVYFSVHSITRAHDVAHESRNRQREPVVLVLREHGPWS